MDYSLCNYVYINTENCIRYTFSKSHCRDCEVICPTKAIVFFPNPKINSNLCIRCGLCYSACKFSAVQIDKYDGELLIETKELDNIDIGCIKSRSEIIITCISRLTDTVLLHWIFDEKEIVINRGNCKKCRLNKGLPYFKKNLKNALYLADAFGLKPKIKFKKNPTREYYIPRDTLSRRDMFSGLIKKIKKNKHEMKREILIKLLKNKEIKKDLQFSGIGKIEINDKCNLCGVCEYVCPMDAIFIKKDKSSGKILFNPTLCINCGECERACVKNAINVKSTSVSYFNKGIFKVFEAKKNVCRICKKEFYSLKDEDICPICKNKEESKKKFLDFLKNI